MKAAERDPPTRAGCRGLLLLSGVAAAMLCGASLAPAGTVALRCWRCREVFLAAGREEGGACPRCGAVWRRVREGGVLRIHCVEEGEDACSFVLECPDGAAVVFAGGRGGAEGVARRLEEIGAREIALAIGAEATAECMRSIAALMRRFPVRQVCDPGFRNDGAAYEEFLRLLRSRETDYRAVRAMEAIAIGSLRLSVIRPSSFEEGDDGDRTLTLCVVHGGTSFLLAGEARGRAAGAGGGRTLFRGDAFALGAAGSPLRRPGPIVIESDGRELGVRSLGHVVVGRQPPRADRTAAGPPRGERAAAPVGEGTVNINTAGQSGLESLSGIGAKKAALIIRFREENGPFARIEDIRKVPGIGQKIFERNAGRLSVR
ncbi:MAG: ComEA family DNA-binding protein [bacterium]|nr:ComEA family DNA-binding protein [bacterium]